MSEWRATFPGGTLVLADESGWSVVGPAAEEAVVSARMATAVAEGWPTLEGWAFDRSPGFDPEWMYLRLLALGAVEVEGPCPPCGVEIEVDDDDVVVG